jgi:copper(I)-binding protein
MFSGNITISSNDPDRATQTLSVSVIVQPPPVPAISVQQTAVNFGTVAFAQTVQQTITIRNTGTASLEITGIQSNVSGLTFTPSMFTVEPNGSQTVTVTFPSSTAGTFSGNITISSNDPDLATQTLSVSVIVQPPPMPVIAVQQTAVNFGTVEVGQTGQRTITIMNTGTAPLAVQQTAVDFGAIEAGQTGQQTFTIMNTGTAPLEVTGIESDVSGLTFTPSMFTLAPNGSRTVTITFPSSTAGTFSGNITISSNDPDRATRTLSVSVIVQPPPVPVIAVQQTAVDFGAIEAGQTGQQTFTIMNTGTAPLEVTGIESDVSGLTFDPVMFTLSPDSSATITITFPKPMEGEFSGSINILSNDPDRAMFMLTISGVVQPLSVEAKSDFDSNGVIEFADFLLFVSAFGSSEAQYDIDGNGSVDFPDFLLFVSVFGKTVDG